MQPFKFGQFRGNPFEQVAQYNDKKASNLRGLINGQKSFFNVKNYGAKGDGVTDDTSYIQSAIQACYDAGGGTVFLPDGVYLLSGALQTSVSGVNPNSQLYLPSLLTLTGFQTKRTHISIVGESKPNFTPNSIFAAGAIPSLKGVILKTTITGSGTAPSVIGGSDLAYGPFGTINYNYLSIENITILVPNTSTGPTMGGINGRDISSLECNNVLVTTDADYNASTNLPSNECAGIMTGKNSAETTNSIRNAFITGFKYGLVLGEHCVLDQVNISLCANGLVYTGAGHPTLAQSITIQWCKTFIFFPNTLILGYAQILQTRFRILLLRGEIWSTAGKWYTYTNFINDPGSNGIGDITHSMFDGATGGTAVDSNLINVGSTGIISRPVIQPFSPIYAIKKVAGNYTLTDKDFILLETTAATTITLPATVGGGLISRQYTIKNFSAGSITVAAASGELIDGLSTLTLTTGQKATLICEAAISWAIIG